MFWHRPSHSLCWFDHVRGPVGLVFTYCHCVAGYLLVLVPVALVVVVVSFCVWRWARVRT